MTGPSEPAAELAIERVWDEAACNRIGESLGEGIACFLRAAMAEPEGIAVEVVAAGTGTGTDDAAGSRAAELRISSFA